MSDLGAWSLRLPAIVQDALADGDNFGRADPHGRIPVVQLSAAKILRRRRLAIRLEGADYLTDRGLEARAFQLIRRRRQQSATSLADFIQRGRTMQAAVDHILEKFGRVNGQEKGAPATAADAPVSPEGGTTPHGTGGSL